MLLQTEEKVSSKCHICSAQATGFHFDAQSCSACAAFFRRTVSLNKAFQCITGKVDCTVHYTMHQICRACRYEKCLKSGMNPNGVQPRRQTTEQRRSFYTASGLKRNKKFAKIEPEAEIEETIMDEIVETSKSSVSPSFSPSPSVSSIKEPHVDALTLLISEEMRLGERRRILFCERPVEKLLGQNSHCPYTREDIRPLSFRAFRKSIRAHILLIYEWLQAWPDYQTLTNNDKVSFLRKCVLFHTILDPVYISIQIGYPDRFVMQNGGYVSCVEGCEEGWEDEKEISGETKRRIYGPLLRKIMAEIIPPMLQMNLSFEEFVALKAFVSWQGAISNVSLEAKAVMRRQLDAISNSLHHHYVKNSLPAAERLGSLILLLSSIFSTGLEFVEMHRQVEFFDLWQLDSLLSQFLNLDAIFERGRRQRLQDTK